MSPVVVGRRDRCRPPTPQDQRQHGDHRLAPVHRQPRDQCQPEREVGDLPPAATLRRSRRSAIGRQDRPRAEQDEHQQVLEDRRCADRRAAHHLPGPQRHGGEVHQLDARRRPRPRGRGRPSWTAASPFSPAAPSRADGGEGRTRRRSRPDNPNAFAMPHAAAGITTQLSTTMSTTSTQRLSGARTCFRVKDMPSESTVATIETAAPRVEEQRQVGVQPTSLPLRGGAPWQRFHLFPLPQGQGSFRPRLASSEA